MKAPPTPNPKKRSAKLEQVTVEPTENDADSYARAKALRGTPRMPTISDIAEHEAAKRRAVAEQLPDIATLAHLAGQSRFKSLSSSDAAKAALELWRECTETLNQQKELVHPVAFDFPIVGTPEKWPATLDDFYKLVVRARDTIDNQPRFKRFLRYQLDREHSQAKLPLIEAELFDKVEQRFAKYQRSGFVQEFWGGIAVDYLRWWKGEMVRNKVNAGKARQTTGRKIGASAKKTAEK